MSSALMGPFADTAARLKSFVTKKDEVTIDNILFRVHHQVNFVFISLGLIFIFAENYIIGGVIECTGGASDYDKKYCFIHGTSYISSEIAKELSGKKCRMTDGSDSRRNTVITSYYMWIPFVLVICMVITKIPRSMWKTGEGGFMKHLRGDGYDAEKIAETFRCIKKRNKFMMYNFSFAICEVFNMASILINFHILHNVLNQKFWSYGLDYHNHLSSSDESVNPMCNVFPTEVGCQVHTGSVVGGADKGSHLCILSNNVFNQYYFLGLWWWWVVLIFISSLALVYRMAQLLLPQVSRAMLKHRLDQAALSETDPTVWKLTSFSSADLFMLARLALNLEKEVIAKVLVEIKRGEMSKKSSRGTEINLEKGIDMIKYDVKDETITGVGTMGMMNSGFS